MRTQFIRWGMAAVALAASSRLAGVTAVPPAAAQNIESRPAAATAFLRITVTDSGGAHIAGLPVTAFTIRERDKQLAISQFSSQEEPSSIGLLVDVSRSVSPEGIRLAQRAIVALVHQAPAGSQYFVNAVASGFSEGGWTSDATATLNRVEMLAKWRESVETPEALWLGNPSDVDIWDAVRRSLDKLKTGSHRRRTLIVASDGVDNISTGSHSDLRESLRRSDATVHLLRLDRGGAWSTVSESKPLVSLVEANGGRAITLKKESDGPKAGDLIALDARHQYVIGVTTPGPADGRWHPVKVTVVAPGVPKVVVRSNEGYLAPKEPRK